MVPQFLSLQVLVQIIIAETCKLWHAKTYEHMQLFILDPIIVLQGIVWCLPFGSVE